MRSRNIKPGFYKNEYLAECSPWARLLAPGLWMIADREGRLPDRPKRIKAEVFPYDNFDIEPLLEELVKCTHIVRYEVDGKRFIQITTFSEHQRPHSNETKSLIPPYTQEVITKEESTSNHGAKSFQPKQEALRSCSLIPSSLIPDSRVKQLTRAQESDSIQSPFQRVYEAGCKVFPGLTTANTSVIHRWILEECDPELDIIPEIQRHSGKDIGAWKYFSSGIMDAKKTRTQPLPEGKSRGNYGKQPTKDERARAAVARAAASLGVT